MTCFVRSMAVLFLLSYKWKRPDRWSLLKVKENTLKRLKWHSASWNLHSRTITSTLLGLIITTGLSERERRGDWAVQHQPIIWPQHAFSFGTYSRHQPLFSCRKCIQPISASYHILLRFLKSQPSNSNKVLHRLPPLENLPGKKTAGK